MKETLSVTFLGSPTGDSECFRWERVPIVTRARMVQTHKLDVEHGERVDTVTPDDVCSLFGCKHDELYRWTITVEKVGRSRMGM